MSLRLFLIRVIVLRTPATPVERAVDNGVSS
jgi:hypothetical protein